jgi:hypothetical protein
MWYPVCDNAGRGEAEKNLATSPGLTLTVLNQRCFSSQQVLMIRKKNLAAR